MATTSFHSFEPYQVLARHMGFAKIEARVYERGEGFKSPDGKNLAYGDEFIITAPNGRSLRFVTPVEWEVEKPSTLTGALCEALNGPTYRVKDQREYVMRMLRECKTQLLEKGNGV